MTGRGRWWGRRGNSRGWDKRCNAPTKLPWRPRRSRKSGSASTPGYARFAYNWALGEFKAGLDVGEWLSDRTLRPRWNVVKKFIAP